MTSSFNEEAKFLILHNNPKNRSNGNEISLRILDNLFSYRAVNVVVMHASDAFSYDIYTGDPFRDPSTCGKMKADNIGRCENGELSNFNVTQHHLSIDRIPDVMENCTFKFCARVQEPFVKEGCHDGLEILIMKFLQNVMKINVDIECSDMDRGELDENGEWTDLLGLVRRDSCDIVGGAFFPDFEVHADFAATEFYFQDFYTFYVKRADLAPRWIGLVTIFKIRAWTAFGVVLIISWIFWWIMGCISRPREGIQHRQIILTLINVIAVQLGVSANNRPLHNSLRMFFSFFAIYSLTINAIYTSKLITVFTNPVHDYQIDTIQEILDKNFSIGGRTENMDWFEDGDDVDRLVFERYNHSADFRPSTKNIERIIENGNIALLMSKLFARSDHLYSDIHGLTQSMFSNNIEMIVERGFPLLRKINKILSIMREQGFMSQLNADFTHNTTILSRIKKAAKNYRQNNVEYSEEDIDVFEDEEEVVDEDPQIVLSLEHLEGGFTLLVMGYLVSAAVFILERLSTINFLKLWKKIHQTIVRLYRHKDNKRHLSKKSRIKRKKMKKMFK